MGRKPAQEEEQGYKRLKDPIYGYVLVDEKIMRDIVDTACFQRLRGIVQTSYAPLYSSAVHNRFIHSLGVYHLGCIVSDVFKKEAGSICGSDKYQLSAARLERYCKLFQLACLLHDLGHAPFSHTGEDQFKDLNEKDNRQFSTLHSDMCQEVKNKEFTNTVKDIEEKLEPAKPHEIMSVIVALRKFPRLFKNNEEKAFFARCITGYTYGRNTEKAQICNCLIKLLNSSVIDVDKLDYLIRDAYITGFDTVKIDYVRLLTSIGIIRNKEGEYQLAYYKSALSVIENVVFAHDAERHWIQVHPVVLYEGYILRHAIELINQHFDDKPRGVFSYDSLTEEGNCLSNSMRVSLLTDDDIIFLMKNVCGDDLTKEYFARNSRRHPAWKSEAEYKALLYSRVGKDSKFLDVIEGEFESLSKYLINLHSPDVLDESAISACEQEIEKTRRKISGAANRREINEAEKLLAESQKHLKWLNELYRVAEESNVPFDFLVLQYSQFNSGFMKGEFERIQIKFPEQQEASTFKDIGSALSSVKQERKKFFYLFYRRGEKGEKLDNHRLMTALTDLANHTLP